MRNSSCGKVMFSQASVILSMGGVMHGEGGHVLQREGPYMVKGGMCSEGGHVR